MSSTTKTPINPVILSWAMQDLSLTPKEVAQKMSKNFKEEKILRWLSGEDSPTYNQLEKLAYSILKLPIAAFFLPEAPENVSITKRFRTLPDSLNEGISYKTRIAVRKAEYFQDVLSELYGKNPSENPIFKTARTKIGNNLFESASKIRNLLGIDFNNQKSFINGYTAFNYYRETLEKLGVFTFQLQLEGDRGFCLIGDEFPVIIVNSSDWINSKIFTLFHELSHILIDKEDVFKEIEDPIYSVNPNEVFCNALAAEILVPKEELRKKFFLDSKTWDETYINKIAKTYSVSKQVILRRLLDLYYATKNDYERFSEKWHVEFSKSKKLNRESSKGPTYYITKKSSLGKGYITTVIENFKIGKIGEIETSNYLDIKIKNLPRLESVVLA